MSSATSPRMTTVVVACSAPVLAALRAWFPVRATRTVCAASVVAPRRSAILTGLLSRTAVKSARILVQSSAVIPIRLHSPPPPPSDYCRLTTSPTDNPHNQQPSAYCLLTTAPLTTAHLTTVYSVIVSVPT